MTNCERCVVISKQIPRGQMRLLHSLSLIIIIIFIVVVVCLLKFLHVQKSRFSLFENNMGPFDGRTDGQTYGRTDRRINGRTDGPIYEPTDRHDLL